MGPPSCTVLANSDNVGSRLLMNKGDEGTSIMSLVILSNRSSDARVASLISPVRPYLCVVLPTPTRVNNCLVPLTTFIDLSCRVLRQRPSSVLQ